MTMQEAMGHMSGALIREGRDRYCFACGKTLLVVRLLGGQRPVRFVAGDRVAFRIDAENLTVEDLRTHAVRKKFSWDRIESVAMGEPESDNSDLFQG